MAIKFHEAYSASNSDRWINGKWTTVSRTTPVFVYDDGSRGGSWKVGSLSIQTPAAASPRKLYWGRKKNIFMKSKDAYYHVQDAYYWTLHCASSIQFTIQNRCSYLYGLLFSFPYGNLPSHSPAKFCTTSQFYSSNTFHP